MKEKKPHIRTILICFLVIYLAVLLRITVFRSHTYPTDYAVNLSLFTDLAATYHENGIWMVLYLVVGNIVWFVPFGFLLPTIQNKLKSYVVIPIGFCLSLFIEVSQLVFEKGMFEIDDLVLNTAGVVIGYLVYKAVHHFKKQI